jgi:soluble lytic murein transglycosylase-like protein
MRHLPRNIASALTIAAGLAVATPASAELLFFSDSQSMSIAGHRVEGDRVIVTLRGGGEMTLDSARVAKILPDEVPYPEPEAAPAAEFVDGGLAAPGQGSPAPALVEKTAFDPIIEDASTRHGVDARLVKAVIQVESGFQSRARSPKGAMGLMQLMPGTAREYSAGRNPYDPARNIQAGTQYLRTLLNKFELPLALAAYNAGEAAVRRFGGIPPYAETQAYVAKILALVGITANYQRQ